MNDEGFRHQIVDTVRRFISDGLCTGTSGNLSIRNNNGILITPSGVPYDALTAADLVQLDSEGAVVSGVHKPSSEWRMHRDILAARTDVNAIVHVHSPSATAIACTRQGIPAFHYEVALVGGDSIRCAPYATFGTAELAVNALAALDARNACLLANHGQITLGTSIDAAYNMAQIVEGLARQYLLSCQFGEPVLLTAAEMQQTLERFSHYGRRDD